MGSPRLKAGTEKDLSRKSVFAGHLGNRAGALAMRSSEATKAASSAYSSGADINGHHDARSL
jgi:hypothetical protein